MSGNGWQDPTTNGILAGGNEGQPAATAGNDRQDPTPNGILAGGNGRQRSAMVGNGRKDPTPNGILAGGNGSQRSVIDGNGRQDPTPIDFQSGQAVKCSARNIGRLAVTKRSAFTAAADCQLPHRQQAELSEHISRRRPLFGL